MLFKVLAAAASFLGFTSETPFDSRLEGKKVYHATFFSDYPTGQVFDLVCGGAGVCITAKDGLLAGSAKYFGMSEVPSLRSTEHGFEVTFPIQQGNFEITNNLTCTYLMAHKEPISLADLAIVIGFDNWPDSTPHVKEWAHIPFVSCKKWVTPEQEEVLQEVLGGTETY